MPTLNIICDKNTHLRWFEDKFAAGVGSELFEGESVELKTETYAIIIIETCIVSVSQVKRSAVDHDCCMQCYHRG